MALGFTVEPQAHRPGMDLMRIGRFTLWGGRGVEAQCAAIEKEVLAHT